MGSKCPKNPNEEIIRKLALEDLPLLKMLATNGKYQLSKEPAIV